MGRIDKIDKIILSALAVDCRRPLSNIGKDIRRSPQFVKYRIDRLKEHTIKNTPLLLDYQALGQQEVVALIKLPIIDPLLERTLVDFLFKRSDCVKLCSTQGNTDLFCSFIVKKLAECEKIKTDIKSVADVDIQFLVNTSSERYGLNYLSEKRQENIIRIEETEGMLVEDERERKIFSELQVNPYQSLLELSGKLKMSYEKVAYAFKHSKIYKGNTLLLSERDVERQIIFCTTTDSKGLSSFCAMNDYVVELNTLLGEYDCMLIIEAEKNVNSHSKQILYEIKEKIENYTIVDCTNWYKYGWYR